MQFETLSIAYYYVGSHEVCLAKVKLTSLEFPEYRNIVRIK